MVKLLTETSEDTRITDDDLRAMERRLEFNLTFRFGGMLAIGLSILFMLFAAFR